MIDLLVYQWTRRTVMGVQYLWRFNVDAGGLKHSELFLTVAFLLFLDGHLCLLQSFALLMRDILEAGNSSFVFVNTNKH